MKKETAVRLMEEINGLNASVNRVAVAIEGIDDETERKAFRRLLAEVIGSGFDLIMPVIRQYPELDSDKDRQEKR